MQAQRTPQGRVRIRHLEGENKGEIIERWPVDARAMVDCGEFEYVAEGEEEQGSEQQVSPESSASDEDYVSPSGYRVESTPEGWHKAFDPDGEQIGKSKRSREEAMKLIPATEQPGGTAPADTAEHSPGVPLVADDEGGEAQPMRLPEEE